MMMFPEDLKAVTWQSIRFVSLSAIDKALATRLQELGIAVFEVDGGSVQDGQDLIRAVADEMRFPAYFGMNWDAFDECLRDMSWRPARGYVLLIRQSDPLSSQGYYAMTPEEVLDIPAFLRRKTD